MPCRPLLVGFSLLMAMWASTGLAIEGPVRIGVLTDANGPFADQAGKGSEIAARLAADDFAAEFPGETVEILFGDHQNKPDIGSSIVRRWVDEMGVAAVVDVPNSAVGLAINDFLHARNRTFLASGVATSDLTGPACRNTTVQWVRDTWAMANAEVRAITGMGRKRWFFISYDYALGRALERDATAALARMKGDVVGTVHHPVNISDFSSYLLQAQTSGADVVALADTGTDAITAIKQASEFGLRARGQMLASLFLELSDVKALGLEAAQGLVLTQGFYWDLNEKTRAWSKRFAARNDGKMPTDNQAGVYSSTLAYLRAVQAAGTLDGDKVVARMAAAPIEDPLYGTTTVRKDGRAVHAMHVFRVKAPAESRGAYDYLHLLSSIAPEDAFRPVKEGGCSLVQ